MSKRNDTPAAEENKTGVDLTGLDHAAPEGSIAIGSAYLYRPGEQEKPDFFSDNSAHCGHLPIQGYVVDVAERNGATGAFDLISILLTKPCLAIENEKHLKAIPGEVVVIVVTRSQSMQLLTEVAEHPTMTNEVWIKPLGKMSLPGGKTMWNWKVRYVGKPKRRSDLVLPSSFQKMMTDGLKTDDFPYGANALPQGAQAGG